MAATSRARVTQCSESAVTCRKLARPVARMLRGCTKTLSSETISKPCNRQCNVTVDLPAPLGPINRIPRPRRLTQAACSDISPWQRAASVNTANSINSYRVWYGNRSMGSATATRPMRSAGYRQTKFEDWVAPIRYPAPDCMCNGGGSTAVRRVFRSPGRAKRVTLRRGALADSRCGGSALKAWFTRPSISSQWLSNRKRAPNRSMGGNRCNGKRSPKGSASRSEGRASDFGVMAHLIENPVRTATPVADSS